MDAGNGTSDGTQTQDELRMNVFGLRGDHNHVFLRDKFPELSIKEALFCLEMVVDNPRDPDITDEQMADVVRTTATLRLTEMVGLDGAACYLERAHNDAYKAYQDAKEEIEIKQKLQETEIAAKADFIESFMAVTGVDYEKAALAGQSCKYQDVEAAVDSYYNDGSVQESPASDASPSSEQTKLWAERFMDLTDAVHLQAHQYGRKHSYSDELFEAAVDDFLSRKAGHGLHEEDEDDDGSEGPGHDRHYDRMDYAFPTEPFHDLDAAIDGNDFTLVSRWTETAVPERVQQLDLAQNLNTFEAFRWIVATSRMTERHERYIRDSWTKFSKDGTRETANIVYRHIRRHNVDAYEDIAKAGGTACSRKDAKRHLRWSEDFNVAMRCGFTVETLAKEQEAGIQKLNAMRTTWRLRLTRLTRLRDLILRPGYGYANLRQAIEPLWNKDKARNQACPPVAAVDGSTNEVDDVAVFDMDGRMLELAIQDFSDPEFKEPPCCASNASDISSAKVLFDDEDDALQAADGAQEEKEPGKEEAVGKEEIEEEEVEEVTLANDMVEMAVFKKEEVYLIDLD